MDNLAIIEKAPTPFSTVNPAAAWDLVSFIANGTNYLKVVGGGVIGLLGLAIVIWAVVLIAKKFFGSQQQQGESWFKVVIMVIVGGAMMTGGIVLITNIAAGGQTTIEELGGGFILLQNTLGLVR